MSQSGITLYFSCQSETAKFHVGMAQGAKPVKLAELVCMEYFCSFQLVFFFLLLNWFSVHDFAHFIIILTVINTLSILGISSNKYEVFFKCCSFGKLKIYEVQLLHLF